MKKFYLTLVFIAVAFHQVIFCQTTFNYTGVVQTYIVPCGADTLIVRGWGGGGGGGGADNHDYSPGGAGGNGGGGAYGSATLAVSAGHVLKIYVGGGGGGGQGCTTNTGAGAGGFGYGAGGRGGQPGSSGCSGAGGGGGGASAIFDSTANTILFAAAGGAGGGGGGGIEYGYGQLGGAAGLNGRADSSGKAYAGRVGANNSPNGAIGDSVTWVGRDGGGGGGGGGGYFGGSGGGAPDCDCGAAGGGGGTSLASVVVNGYYSSPGDSTDPALCNTCSRGGAGDVIWENNSTAQSGGNGLLIITFIGGDSTFVAQVSPVDTTVCTGSQVNLLASGGTVYQWSPGTGLSDTTVANPVASPLSTTTYYVTVTSGLCTTTDSAVITVTPGVPGNPGLVFPPLDTLCGGGNAVLFDTGSTGNIQWKSSTNGTIFTDIPGAVSDTLTVINPTQTMYYEVLATGQCISQVVSPVATVTVSNSPIVTVGPDTSICSGGDVTLMASGGTGYLWSPGTGLSSTTVANPVANPLSTTTYYVSVTNNICTTTDSAVITVTPTLPGNAGLVFPPLDTLCSGSNAILFDTGSTGNIQWKSSTNGTTFTDIPGAVSDTLTIVNPTQSMYYEVQTTGQCVSEVVSQVASVTVNSSPLATVGPDTSICSGNDVSLLASGGTDYQWSPGTGLSSTIVANPVASPLATTTYYVSVTNNLCTATDSVVITVLSSAPGSPGLVFPPFDTLCTGGNAVLFDTGSTGNIQWKSSTNGTTFTDIPGAVSDTLTIVNPTQTMYYELQTSSQCSSPVVSQVATVTVISPPLVTVGPDTSICSGSEVALLASGGTGYQWSPGTGLSSTIVANPLASPLLTTTYYVSVTNNICTAIDSVVITVTSGTSDAGTISPAQYMGCSLNPVLMTDMGSSGLLQWQYSTDGVHFTNLPGAVGNTCTSPDTAQVAYYRVEATGSCGATSYSAPSVIGRANPPTVMVTTSKNIFCFGDSTQVCATAGFASYQWNDGVSGTACIEVTDPGNYYVQVTDSNGCTAQSNHLAISEYPVPSVSVEQHGDTITSLGAVSYQWILNNIPLSGDTGSFYILQQSGSYSVQVTDSNGCTSFSNPIVIITSINHLTHEESVSIYPNPNSAGSWQLTVGNELTGAKLEVYNDEGRLVFQSTVTNPQSQISLDVASGVYYLRLSNAAGSVVRKLVKL